MPSQGDTFNRLRLLRKSKRGPENRAFWLCGCVCGKRVWIVERDIQNGHTKSCGCWMREKAKAQNTTHGFTGTPTYDAWAAMIQRCNNSKDGDFKDYGARGIRVCRAWKTFDGFLASMGPRPSKGFTLERRDNNGDYRPGNVKWASRADQAQNTRRNHLITFKGETLCLSQMARRHGLTPSQLGGRLYWGWTIERALTQRIKRRDH